MGVSCMSFCEDKLGTLFFVRRVPYTIDVCVVRLFSTIDLVRSVAPVISRLVRRRIELTMLSMLHVQPLKKVLYQEGVWPS